MAGAYRAGPSDEGGREIAAGMLLASTHGRLRQACDHDGALAWSRPRWVGRPASWLIGAVTGAGVLALPLLMAFGRIDAGPFAARAPERLMLVGACVWGLALAAMAARSWWLRQGSALAPGLYLFATGLVEVRGQRVRTWPIGLAQRVVQRGAAVTIDLGQRGRVRLTTTEDDLADSLVALRDRLALATSQGDTRTQGQIDPLCAEHDRAFWRPLGAEAPAAWGGTPGRAVALGALGLAAAAAPGALLAEGVRRLSDDLGIGRARQLSDEIVLHAYVWQGGPLADQADRAWLDLALAPSDDRLLHDYLGLDYVRHRREADEAMAGRVLRRATPERPGGPWLRLSPPMKLRQLASGEVTRELDLAAAAADLRGYLAVGRERRAEVEQRLFELDVARSERVECDSTELPLAPYLGLDDARGEQARAVHLPRYRLRRGVQCQSLGDLDAAHDLSPEPAHQAAVTAALVSYFRAQQRETARRRLPPPLDAMLDELWGYLAEHPATPRRSWLPVTDGRPWREPAGDEARWQPLVRVADRAGLREQLATQLFLFEGRVPVDLARVEAIEGGPWLSAAPDARGLALEVTLALPGRPPRTEPLKL